MPYLLLKKIVGKYKNTENINTKLKEKAKSFPMAHHGHFLSFASFPLPLPLPLLERLNIERVIINIYPVRDLLLVPLGIC